MVTPDVPRRPRGRPAGTGVIDDDELLDRTLVALARGGYRGLSMRGLARDLGVSLASVQYRHATKDALWRAAIDRVLDETGPPQDAPDDPFPVLLRRRVATAARYPGLMLSLLSDDAAGHEARRAYLLERLAPSFSAARATVAAASEAGLIRDIDVGVVLALVLVGVGAVGALPDDVRRALDLGPDSDARLADGLADLLLLGIVAR